LFCVNQTTPFASTAMSPGFEPGVGGATVVKVSVGMS